MSIILTLLAIVGVVVLLVVGYVAWVLFKPEKRAPLKSSHGTIGMADRANASAPAQPPPSPASPARDPYKNWGMVGAAMKRSAEQRQAREEGQKKIKCQFCQETGFVTIAIVPRKKGISGTKATGAVLTGGMSVILTGLSQRGQVAQLTCSNCSMVSYVE